MKLWLDDIRDPVEHTGETDWVWVKTSAEAIKLLETGKVKKASLDHDLEPEHYPWILRERGIRLEDCKNTGYDVVLWMSRHRVWPINGVRVHSQHIAGKARMDKIISKHYLTTIL